MGRIASNIKYQSLFSTIDESEDKNVYSTRLKIPEFQRNYVWKKNQIKELLDSIKENKNGYFIWNIVTINSKSWSVSRDILLDWQQRLVTLSLLLNVIITKYPRQRKSINELLFEWKYPRILFSRKNLKQAYEKLLKDWIEDKNWDVSQRKIYSAYSYIKDYWITSLSDKEITSLINKVKNVEFVVIKCDNEDDAFQLFAGLNSTWLSLSPVDLVKNAFLWQVKKSAIKIKLDSAIEKWEKIESLFEKNNLAWFLKFLRYLTYQTDWYVGQSALYRIIYDNKIKWKAIWELESFIDGLIIDSNDYIELRNNVINNTYFNGMPSPLVGKTLSLLTSISELWLEQIYAIVFSMLKYWRINSRYFRGWGWVSQFYNNLEKLWYFIVIIKFTDISPSAYEKLFADNSRNIFSNKWKLKKDFFEELWKIASPNKDSFVTYFSDANFSYYETTIKFLLKEFYEVSSFPIKEEDITLEHIIPQNDAKIRWANLRRIPIWTINKTVYKPWNLSLLESILNTTIEWFEISDKVTNWFKKSKITNASWDVIIYEAKFDWDPIWAVSERWQFLSWRLFDFIINKITT